MTVDSLLNSQPNGGIDFSCPKLDYQPGSAYFVLQS
jgi:hypothetical protein